MSHVMSFFKILQYTQSKVRERFCKILGPSQNIKNCNLSSSPSSKGQLISKCLFGVFNFFQKNEQNKLTWGIILLKLNSFVHFLEEFTAWQFAYEFYRPLKPSNMVSNLAFISVLVKSVSLECCFFFLSFSVRNYVLARLKIKLIKWRNHFDIIPYFEFVVY